MSKVVLLAVNAKYVHSSLSVWVIAGGIARFARSQHETIIIEATINQPCCGIVDSVAASGPDVIGISSYIWNAGMLPELLRSLRERLPEALLVLGGPEASNNAGFWLGNGADHVLSGEGEYAFPRFLDSLSGSLQLSSGSNGFAVGIGGNSNSDVSIGGNSALDYPVDPYTDAYFDALNGRLAYIEASRGCPFRCSFCLSAGSMVRYFPLESIKEQILKLARSNTKTLKFVDRTFNCNKERAFEIFEFIIDLETSCIFHFEVAADLFDERILSLLETAPPGRIQFEIGLQSFHEPALIAVERKMDAEKAERNILALLKMKNIHIHIDLIAGLPYESLDCFAKSFVRAYLLNTHTLQLGFLKLLHGSELRKQADKLGIKYSAKPPYEIICSPWLSAGDIQILKNAENALRHTRNKGRFLTTLDYTLKVAAENPFSLMGLLGASVPNHATQLEDYAVQVYDFLASLPGVDKERLKDCMSYDWLGMVKGKNTPAFLKNNDKNRCRVANEAERVLGRKIRREEYAVLLSGKGIFADSNNRSPVTGLHKVYYCS